MLEHGNSEYWTGYNGEHTHVYKLDDAIRAILCRNKHDEDEIKRLREENKRLKDESYKDKELQAMKEEMKLMKEEYYRGFPITEKQEKAISEWKRKHDEEVHGVRRDVPSYKTGRGGYFSYHFYPTSLGTCGEVHCSCGAKFEFQEIG